MAHQPAARGVDVSVASGFLQLSFMGWSFVKIHPQSQVPTHHRFTGHAFSTAATSATSTKGQVGERRGGEEEASLNFYFVCDLENSFELPSAEHLADAATAAAAAERQRERQAKKRRMRRSSFVLHSTKKISLLEEELKEEEEEKEEARKQSEAHIASKGRERRGDRGAGACSCLINAGYLRSHFSLLPPPQPFPLFLTVSSC